MSSKSLPFETGIQSRTSKIDDKLKVQLWVKAGGRCQYSGCNIPLWLDELTIGQMNAGYIAHIVADSPNGPRGDSVRSPKLANDIANLMLLCGKHHKLVDVDQVENHPEDLLIKMKDEHESRVQILTGINNNKKTEVVLYQSNIGPNQIRISQADAYRAVIPDFYPSREKCIQLGSVNSENRDHDADFWQYEIKSLRRQFNERIKPNLSDGSFQHISLFAIAPQPLLIYLGFLFSSELVTVEPYQLHRSPKGWSWSDQNEIQDVKIIEPTDKSGTPVLLISLSAEIHPRRITEAFNGSKAIWEVTIENPNSNFLNSKEQLEKIRVVFRKVLELIKFSHGNEPFLHVFPVMPIAAAIELGRTIMPKAHIPLKIYDQNNERKGFIEALSINRATLETLQCN